MLLIFKFIFDFFFKIITFPLFLSFVIRSKIIGERKAMLGLSQIVSIVPGYTGILLRRALYKNILNGYGDNSTISFGVLFSSKNVRIGNNVYIGPFSEIGQVDIDDNVHIGSHVFILSGKKQHIFEKEGENIKLSEGGYSKIYIGCCTWIGTGAIIMTNVGKYCLIGAGSIVTKEIPNNKIAVGNPAKILQDIQDIIKI